ncbi:MAG: sensor histidine kinase [Anaerolineae bacterium]
MNKPEIQAALARLAKLEQTKSAFISIAAHELKTPLTLVQGYATILGERLHSRPDADELAGLVAGILRGAQRLSEIIEDMIDVASIEAQSLELNLEPLSLEPLVDLAVREALAGAPERQVHIQVEELAGLPQITGDAQRLHQALVRIISNGIKYTPDGGRIDISGRLLYVNDAQPDVLVELTITDTGIGIPPEELEWIFEKFYRVGDITLHSTSKSRFKGAGPGLGLTIARGIIEAHGGIIWAESPGYDETRCPGSTFHVILPVRQGSSPARTRYLLQSGLLRTSGD